MLTANLSLFFNRASLVFVPALPGGAAGPGGLPGVQAGLTERVQAAGRAEAGPGQSADQDRCQQDTENL